MIKHTGAILTDGKMKKYHKIYIIKHMDMQMNGKRHATRHCIEVLQAPIKKWPERSLRQREELKCK